MSNLDEKWWCRTQVNAAAFSLRRTLGDVLRSPSDGHDKGSSATDAEADLTERRQRSLALLHLYLHLLIGQYKFATGLLPFSANGDRQNDLSLV
ncbi:MAG: hypothetical protein H0T51_12075 [Pirellulales bacterium]|nr:hypothetical protein [Pirellulales bacterium]